MMKQKPAKPIEVRRPTVLIGALAAGMFFVGPDNSLDEGKRVMTKTAAADEAATAKRDSSMPPARDPAVAVAEEYQLARQQGTAKALELFIARHGDSPLTDQARAELSRLAR